MSAIAAPDVPSGEAAIVELRRYALHPGARERLIALFDREFVETQEAVGMWVIGQFRDLNAPDSFVWFRGFPNMEGRKAALTSFYGGPVWAAHRDEANGTMVDSDNVFLLRPASKGAGFRLDDRARSSSVERISKPGYFALMIYHLRRSAEEGFYDVFENVLMPQLHAPSVARLATLITESSTNTFPRLPVREGEKVLVNLLRVDAHVDHAALRQRVLTGALQVSDQMTREPEMSLLTPTARSLLR
jgi:NIPSNAP